MSLTKTSHNLLLEKAICKFLGHKFKTTKKVTDHFKEYECKICHLCVTNDAKGNKIHLSEEMKDINETLSYIYQRKNLAL